MVLDELYEEGGIRLNSLLENNAFQLTQDYIRKMAGHLGMARIGFKSEAAFDAFIERARRTAPDYKIDGEKFQEQIGMLTVLKKMVMGQPLYDVSQNRAARRIGRILRDFNFTRLMGQAGASQVVDGWNIAREMGVRSIWRISPPSVECSSGAKRPDDWTMIWPMNWKVLLAWEQIA